MSPQIGALIVGIGILGLFWLDRDPDARTSKALWIPMVWLLFQRVATGISVACRRRIGMRTTD